MVTRKVARSKRDAIAIAEAQLRESESDTEEKEAAKPTSRRAIQAASAARAREGKARADAAKAAKKSAAEAKKANAKLKTPSSTPVFIHKGGPIRPHRVRYLDGDDVPATSTSAGAGEQPTASEPASAASRLSVSTRNAGLTISTRNGGSRRLTPTSAAANGKNGVSQAELLREELERKLQFVDPAITARFGQLVWARRAAFPFWPALILDPRLLPEHQLPSALKELDEKCWVQLYGSRDIRQILFSALAAWDDTSHPYREGFPRSDFHRLTKLKDTFAVALDEASDQEKLTAAERLNIFKTEVVPSLGLPIPAALPGIRKRRKIAKVSKPETPTSQASQANAIASSTSGASNTLRAPQVNGSQSRVLAVATDAQNERVPTFVADEVQGDEPESRYRLGQLSEYTARLRTVVGKSSPDRIWRVQLLLSQLLDEKAFLREDLETAGVWEVLALVQDSENERWRELVETVSVHLKNCTLEEWPSSRKPPSVDTSAQKRPASAPLLPEESDDSADPKRMRTSASTSKHGRLVGSTSEIGRSVEAMAEAVARSMIPRASFNAFRSPNRMPPPEPGATTTMPSAAESSLSSSSSAITSVGVNVAPPRPASSGSSFVLPNVDPAPGLYTPQTASYGGGVGFPAAARATSSTGVSISQQTLHAQYANSTSQAVSRYPVPERGPTIAQPPGTTASGRTKVTAVRSFGPAISVPAPQASEVAQGATRSNPSLVIFNKDGTLLDFQTTWTSWVESQAWRFETALGRPIRDAFFHALGYNAHTRTMHSGSVFNTTPKHELGPKFAIQFLQEQGLQHMGAVRFVNQHWSLPKEVATFRARRDLPPLFRTIRELGVKIAVVTSDRREVTTKTLTHLGVLHLIDAVSCGDDGIANSPERIWTICNRLGVSTANTVMVGDTADDMVLARSAGCALALGVMGGASELSELSAEADFLVPCVTNVIKLLFQYRQQAAAHN